MKVIKSIGLFFIYPCSMLFLGFGLGIKAEHFFYPGESAAKAPFLAVREESAPFEEAKKEMGETGATEAAVQKETLTADTKYLLEEVDVLRNTQVETARNLPGQYIGMDRETFLAAMESYQSAPPLTELERGFESLEVLAFSGERVKVRMNYRYVQPGEGFYIAAADHELVVYLEDKKTIYINHTGIWLDNLPEDMQLKVMQMYHVEGEGNLYNFLETYSS